jgi:uncharacterized protein YfaT (DUF1175 family)
MNNFEAKIPKQWNTAFLSVHNNSGVVRSSNRRPLTLHPSSFMTVSGMVKMKAHPSLIIRLEAISNDLNLSQFTKNRLEFNNHRFCSNIG